MYDFGQRIQYLRKASGYTQAQLAKKLKKSKSAICRYESGEKTPSLETPTDISVLFNVSLDYLAGKEQMHVRSLESLTPSQMQVLDALLLEFRNKGRYPQAKLTQRQLDLINEIISEFLNLPRNGNRFK